MYLALESMSNQHKDTLQGFINQQKHLSPFALTVTPPRRGPDVERAFPPVFVLTRVDV